MESTSSDLLMTKVAETLSDIKPLKLPNHAGNGYNSVNDTLDFSRRLETFKLYWWACKPLCWSPWKCARYGWVCIEKDLMQCVQCKRYLACHLPPVNIITAYKTFCDKFIKCIVDSHCDTCFFKSEPTPVDKCIPNVTDRKMSMSSFSDRYRSFVENKDKINNSVNFDADCLNELSAEQFKILENLLEDESASNKLIILALCGWHLSSMVNRSDLLISCDQCNRNIALWLFQDLPESKISDSNNDDDVTAPAAKIARLCTVEKKRILHAAKQHNPWCPWLHKVHLLAMCLDLKKTSDDCASNCENAEVPRWKALLSVLLHSNNANHTLIDVTEQFARAKSLLSAAVDPAPLQAVNLLAPVEEIEVNITETENVEIKE